MLTQLLTDFLLIFVPMFVVIDPAGTLPLFVALTHSMPELRRRQVAYRATAAAAVVGVVFVCVGQAIFSFLGVKFADFQIAGGILLVILAIIDLLGPGKPAISAEELEKAGDRAVSEAESISVVPLAVPLIVGPATMTTGLLLVSTYSPKYSEIFGPQAGPIAVVGMVCIALVLNILILYVFMRHAAKVERVVGRNTMLVVNKIVMILLAAIAVSLIRLGVTSIVTELSHK